MPPASVRATAGQGAQTSVFEPCNTPPVRSRVRRGGPGPLPDGSL